MPELPDVEGFRRLLAATAAGQRIREITVPAPDILRNTSPQALGRALAGGRLGEPRRHGKWLCAPAADRLLLLHFGMDGGLDWVPAADVAGCPPGRYDRLVLRCQRGELRYRSRRKLGGAWLVPGAAAAEVTGPLGPDALGLDLAGLQERLAGRRGAVKPALMDQSVIAGLGNLTVDEILWRARVHPLTPVRALGGARLRRVHGEMREVLAGSVKAGRVPGHEGWLTGARDDRPAVCPRCGTRLARTRVVGRGTAWCPHCQPDPAKAPHHRPD
ncbi:MAG: Fpg/Nei family DNA glycosylase [Gemmatimonadota bacterium]